MATIKKVSVEAKLLDGFKIETRSRGHVALVDQPEAGGGTDSGPTPLEYLFISQAGCIATVGQIIAKQQRLPVRGIEVKVEGELDVDVLMGKSQNGRSGFGGIRIITRIDADMTRAEKEAYMREIDQRCPISDNIINYTPVEVVVE